MNIGEKITRLLNKNQLTKRQLAEKLGLKDSSVISHWTNGRFYPSLVNKRKLAELFSVPCDYFDNDAPVTGGYYGQYSPVEVVARENAASYAQNVSHIGTIASANDDVFDISFDRAPSGYLPILLESYGDKRIFAVEILCDKFYPSARRKDFVIVEQTDKADNGEMVLVRINQGGYTFRRYYRDNATITLRADNSSVPAQYLKPGEVEINGRVKGFFRLP